MQKGIDVELIKLKADALDTGHLKLATWGNKEKLVQVLMNNGIDPYQNCRTIGDEKMRNSIIEEDIKRKLEKYFQRVDEFDTEKGGIYVETTDDFRGWVLGDETRKIYKMPSLYAKVLTDLLVIIVPNNEDGNEVKVSVYNSGDIGRMLLSKNNDVGDAVQYAQIESSKPTELIAKMGDHICIESLMRGSWIRMRVYPGENILETLKKDECEIMNFLVSPEVDTKKVLARLVTIYRGAEEEINIILSKMERHGKVCNCDESLIFRQVDESGKFDDISQMCLNCGGTVDR